MELRQLRYFVAVAEEMHFNRAAERLHIAQPALSQQIRKLEHELRVSLLTRTTRSVDLTDAGRVFLPEARRVLADADHAHAAARHAADGESGLLRVGFVSSAALRFLPAFALEFKRQWPRVHLQLQEGTTDQQLEAIDEGRVDVGIVRELGDVEDRVVRELARERLVLAVPHGHRLAGAREAAFSDLTGESFVVFPRHRVSRLYDHIAALCHQAGVRLEVAQEAVQFPTILGLVAAEAGIAVVPDSLRALRIRGLTYVELTDPRAYSTVSIVANPDRASSPLVSRCLEIAGHVAALSAEGSV